MYFRGWATRLRRYLTPGVTAAERTVPSSVEGVPTGTVGFVGETETGPSEPRLVRGFGEFEALYGGYGTGAPPAATHLAYAVDGFFRNGGRRCYVARVAAGTAAAVRGDGTPATGLAALAGVDEVAVVCVPAQATNPDLAAVVTNHCETAGDRFAVLAAPNEDPAATTAPLRSRDAALYVPWLDVATPDGGGTVTVPPVGHVAGVYARTDAERGVHKAPANEQVRGIVGLAADIDDGTGGLLTTRGVNPVRSFPDRGVRVWGARTLAEDPTWRYVPVRRLALYFEESMTAWLRWTETEPNDERTRERVASGLSNFLALAWRDGALAGETPERAFFVRCDRSTTTAADVAAGRLVAEVGFAPTRPAEFVALRLVAETGG
ncbi:phage tail sheath family protein [Halosegnis marinus]|uniref:Phage tail sheath family protein n=1 Tax=Halosegnis marinus TaxID=3034023 RepID=A0ABD5ZM96_9EURY|nr:phage tail sheath subtilisin-like domain-containing protein [Halosegnis sp. DT85]